MVAKPKPIMPLLGIGQAFVAPTPVPPMARNGGMQVIKEPFAIVGLRSGKTYTTGNEDVERGGKPEIVTIMPTDRPYAPQQEAGQQQALTGDQLIGLGYDQNADYSTPEGQARLQQIQQAAQGQGLLQNPQPQQSAPQQQPQIGQVAPDPLAQQRIAQMQTQALQKNQLGLAATDISANRAVVDARNATIVPQQSAIDAQGNYINAQGKVLNQQGVELAGTRNFIQQQQGADVARQAELTGINAANNNVADKNAVAQAANARANDAYKYQLAGLAQPQQVQVNPGQEGQVTAPGTQAALETQGAYLQRTSAQNEQQRSLTLDQAKLAVQLLGTDTAAAQQAAAKVGLTVDEAQRMVSQSQLGVQQASNAATLTGLDVQAAGNDVAASKINEAVAANPPFPGATLYTDPMSGVSSWMTPDQANQAKQGYERAAALRTPGTQLYTNPETGSKSYETPARIDALNAEYERKFNISQAGSKYNVGDFGSMSDGAVLTLLGSDTPLTPESIESARQALYARNPNHTDVDLQIKDALNTRAQRKSNDPLDALLKLVQSGEITYTEYGKRVSALLAGQGTSSAPAGFQSTPVGPQGPIGATASSNPGALTQLP